MNDELPEPTWMHRFRQFMGEYGEIVILVAMALLYALGGVGVFVFLLQAH